MSRRTATRVLEDAGDVIRDVNLVDVSASETLVGAQHTNSAAVAWSPATRPDLSLYQFRVKGRSGDVDQSHTLETNLGRLSRVYPASVLATAQRITQVVTGTSSATAFAEQALEYALRQWKLEFPWLDWETLPQLRVSTSSGNIRPTLEALAFRQDPTRPTSMRRFVDEILALFAGYVLRVTAAGKLQLVPPPTTFSKSVTNDQLLSIDRGVTLDEIINRATVTSRQWGFQPAQLSEPFTISFSADYPAALAAVDGTGPNRPEYTHLGTFLEDDPQPAPITIPLRPGIIAGLTENAWADIRVERYSRAWDEDENGYVTSFGAIGTGAAFQEITLAATATAGDTTLQVSPLHSNLPANSNVTFSNGVIARVQSGGNTARNSTTIQLREPLSGGIPNGTSGLHSGTILSPTYPGNRMFHYLPAPADPTGPLLGVWASQPPGAANLGQWVTFQFGDWPPRLSRTTGPPDEMYWLGFRLVVTLWSFDFVATNTTVSATFGRADTSDATKQPGIVQSQADYGIVERNLDAGFINLDVDDALSIAEAYVAANMAPRERVTLEITPDLPILPADINKIVRLPGTEDVIVESWEHNEIFGDTNASTTTRITGVVETPGTPIDPGLRSFSHDFDRSYAGGLGSPQDN